MAIIDRLLLKLNPKAVIERSRFFDKDWYKKKYGVTGDPASHYLKEGWLKDFNPSEKFSTKDYLINNPDISGINPLVHYEVFGKNEGRRPFVPMIEDIGDYKADKIDIPYGKYYRIIENKALVSFDVFDTLVNRPFVKAEDLFDYLEKEYASEGFSDARIKAEKDARAKLRKEVDLKEIYQFIAERYRFLEAEEKNSEIRFCYCNQMIFPIYAKAKELGKRVIATSDMYLNKNTIQKILNDSGYVMDEIYVSCDVNKTKGTGELFKHVLNEENVKPQEMIHFGDNYISDFSEARNNDIESYQTPKIVDQAVSDKKNHWLLSFLNRHETLSSSVYVSQAAEHLNGGRESSYFSKLGYLLGGPLAYGYLNFVCKEAEKGDIDGLFFVSRDGWILKDLYEKYLAGRYRFSAVYAYLSRAAVYSGGIDNHLNNDLYTLLDIAKHHIPEIIKERNAEEYNIHKEEVDAWSRKQSSNLKKHLEQLGGSFETIATVDMFSGNYTAQKAAAYYLGTKVKTGFYAGNFAENEIRHESYARRLLGMRDNLPVKVSEFLITSYEDPIIGVNQKGMPIYEVTDRCDRRERYERIREGIHSYFDDQIKLFDVSENTVLSLEEWLDLCTCYLNECPEEDVEKLSEIIDSEGPVMGNKDTGFDVLIGQFRKNGY